MEDQVVPLSERSYEAGWEKRIILLTLILVLLSFVGCATISILEIISSPPERTVLPLETKPATSVQPALRPRIHPLKLLPARIEDFMTNALQPVPGYENYMAEAIYQPESEDLSKVVPVNTYVRITFFGQTDDAKKAIRDDLVERYPRSHRTINRRGLKAACGFGRDQGSFFIGWFSGPYAVEVDTSFVSGIPGTKDSFLYDTGTQVAVALQNRLESALPRK